MPDDDDRGGTRCRTHSLPDLLQPAILQQLRAGRRLAGVLAGRELTDDSMRLLNMLIDIGDLTRRVSDDPPAVRG